MKQLWVFYLSMLLLVGGNVLFASTLPWPTAFAYAVCAGSVYYVGYLGGWSAAVRRVRSRYLVLDKDDHEKVFMGGLRVGAEEALIAVEAHGEDYAEEAAERVRQVVRRDMSEYDDHYNKWVRAKDVVAPNTSNAWEKAP